MSDREPEFPTLRTTGPASSGEAAAPLSTPYGVSESVELVVDLLAATKLVPEDRLAMAPGRAQQTRSLAAALVEEGVASSEGIARMLAARHQLALVDLNLVGVVEEAAREVPLHVLERVVAIPFVFQDGVLRVAVADPSNLHGIDELRLATRHQLELGVASGRHPRRDPQARSRLGSVRLPRDHPRREALAEQRRTSPTRGRRRRRTSPSSDSSTRSLWPPGRRLRRHFARERGARRPLPDRRRARDQHIPKRLMPGVTTRLKVLASSTSPSGGSRRTAASRSMLPRQAECSTSVLQRSRRSRASRS
jgi:hypothetical protein